MSLPSAHEGYEYQDLLTVNFVLSELLSNSNAEFLIDRKEFKADKMDDLTIIKGSKREKKQVKYSNDVIDHSFTKANLASESSYNLSLDSLYNSWLLQPDKETTEFRLCLAWNEPTEDLKRYILNVDGVSSFESFPTKIFRINAESIWPDGKQVDSNWRRFKKVAKGIERTQFLEFCNSLILELEMPKFSLDLNQPGQLERLVINQAKKLGIGVYPNEHLSYNHFIYEVLAWVKRSRSKVTTFTISDIIRGLNIKTDYGRIEQKFTILAEENIQRSGALDDFVIKLKNSKKVILLGEPGSGKSWFIQNLEKKAIQDGIAVVRHYCYTHLDDALQTERIKTNTFYGNLIHDLVEAFPGFESAKQEKYASNLPELNILLGLIDQPTFLIVDGLDHIERIFNFRQYSDVTKEEISIIEKLNRLEVSNYVTLVVVSQNVPELEILDNFETLYIPSWSQTEIQEYLVKRRIEDIVIQDNSRSQLIFSKSQGNALYIKYLVDEIEKGDEQLTSLPDYSYNLSLYYSYLTNKLQHNDLVPQILSGVSFSLTQTELCDITGQGKFVEKLLKILSPVLKLNLANKGYLIYHESFRRFILEDLKRQDVSLEKRIFRPVAEWFSSLDFYNHPKSFRYLLQFLCDYGKWRLALDKLNKDFVRKSIISGHSFRSIEHNFNHFVIAACREKSIEHLILLNELGKTVSAAEDNFPQLFEHYIEAFGSVNGFGKITQYLVFEGQSTVDPQHGLLACYVSHCHGSSAPWELYINEIDRSNGLSEQIFPFFILGLLVLRQRESLLQIADNVCHGDHENFKKILARELKQFEDKGYVQSLVESNQLLESLLVESKSFPKVEENEILALVVQICAFNDIHDSELDVLEQFFSYIPAHAKNTKLISKLSGEFKNRNWFFNWIIYYINIKVAAQVGVENSLDLATIFNILVRDTEPFKGRPRTSDLYHARHFIYQSFEEGLELITEPSLWPKVIDVLVTISNETTTYLQRSQGGPLSTSFLIKILRKFSSESNRELIGNTIKDIVANKEDHQLHLDIAEYLFCLASHQRELGNNAEAENSFQRGVDFGLAYTMRKDYSLQDAVKGLKYFHSLNPKEAMMDARLVREMADSVVNHTDGKGTSHYPVEWFESYAAMDFRSAALFNRHELVESAYNWRAESGLVQLLIQSNKKIDARIAFYLVMTIPLEDSESFICYCLDLMDTLVASDACLCEKIAARLLDATKPRDSREINNAIILRLNEALAGLNMGYRRSIRNGDLSKRASLHGKVRNSYSRRALDDMAPDEMLLYFNTHGAQESDLNSLYYFFSQRDRITDFLKDLIVVIIKRNNSDYSGKLEINAPFEVGGDIECFYWVARFVYDYGGWFERFINQDAWTAACRIDEELAFNFLFELLPAISEAGVKMEYSSNLLKTMIVSSYFPEKVINAWKNIIEVTESRLPSIEHLNWNEILDDSLSMTNDEIFICILICRLRAGSVERFQWTITGLESISEFAPALLVKPFLWFFENKSLFIDSAIVVVLQLILGNKRKGENVSQYFEEHLVSMFPTRHFVKDYLISEILELELPELIWQPNSLVYADIEPGLKRYLQNWNLRFNMLERLGLDLDNVYNKYSATFHTQFPDLHESYGNRLYKIWLPHVHSSDYLNRLISEDCYQGLQVCGDGFFPEAFEYGILFDLKSIVVNLGTRGPRPLDLDKPHFYEGDFTIRKSFTQEDWIRLAHVEEAYEMSGISQKSHTTIYAATVFFDHSKKDYPFSDNRLYPDHIWGTEEFPLEIQHKPIFCIKQESQIETLNILWLHPTVIQNLNLKVRAGVDGLMAVDSNNEIVLKMRSWCVDYLGDGYRSNLKDEIPAYTGSELLIRKELFSKLCDQFDSPPAYNILKIVHQDRNEED